MDILSTECSYDIYQGMHEDKMHFNIFDMIKKLNFTPDFVFEYFLKFMVFKQTSVTGYDNIILSKVATPPITTVDQHNYELGHKSVEVLVDILNDKEVEEKYI